jgi:drug/metabolite transporter (DMT)-like permease
MLQHRTGQFLVLLLLGFIWGSSFILMKKGLVVFNSWQVASMRLAFAGLIAVPFLVSNFKKIQKKDWLFLLLAGFIGNGFPAYMFTYAQQTLESGLVGGLNSLTPLFTLIVGLLFFGIKVTKMQLIGMLTGLAGALIMILQKINLSATEFHLFPILIVFIATLFYGFNINIIKSKIGHVKPVLAGMIPLSLISFPATLVLFATETPQTYVESTHEFANMSLLAVFILGIIGTAISLFIFNALIQKTDALFGSSVNYILPFVAAFWGILDGELFSLLDLVGLLFIITGIYLIRRPKLKF